VFVAIHSLLFGATVSFVNGVSSARRDIPLPFHNGLASLQQFKTLLLTLWPCLSKQKLLQVRDTLASFLPEVQHSMAGFEAAWSAKEESKQRNAETKQPSSRSKRARPASSSTPAPAPMPQNVWEFSVQHTKGTAQKALRPGVRPSPTMQKHSQRLFAFLLSDWTVQQYLLAHTLAKHGATAAMELKVDPDQLQHLDACQERIQMITGLSPRSCKSVEALAVSLFVEFRRSQRLSHWRTMERNRIQLVSTGCSNFNLPKMKRLKEVMLSDTITMPPSMPGVPAKSGRSTTPLKTSALRKKNGGGSSGDKEGTSSRAEDLIDGLDVNEVLEDDIFQMIFAALTTYDTARFEVLRHLHSVTKAQFCSEMPALTRLGSTNPLNQDRGVSSASTDSVDVAAISMPAPAAVPVADSHGQKSEISTAASDVDVELDARSATPPSPEGSIPLAHDVGGGQKHRVFSRANIKGLYSGPLEGYVASPNGRPMHINVTQLHLETQERPPNTGAPAPN
jgi:hypothetical protein